MHHRRQRRCRNHQNRQARDRAQRADERPAALLVGPREAARAGERAATRGVARELSWGSDFGNVSGIHLSRAMRSRSRRFP